MFSRKEDFGGPGELRYMEGAFYDKIKNKMKRDPANSYKIKNENRHPPYADTENIDKTDLDAFIFYAVMMMEEDFNLPVF